MDEKAETTWHVGNKACLVADIDMKATKCLKDKAWEDTSKEVERTPKRNRRWKKKQNKEIGLLVFGVALGSESWNHRVIWEYCGENQAGGGRRPRATKLGITAAADITGGGDSGLTEKIAGREAYTGLMEKTLWQWVSAKRTKEAAQRRLITRLTDESSWREATAAGLTDEIARRWEGHISARSNSQRSTRSVG
ncbi:hypothetical protein PIB30_065305 [Stylosanthes scabra]|uniref:Uncharacterized protein n=1 Tax=Stylosanthes scabra TaxID=79078 RepID=A0ABU6UNP1_9FABA|nr:hypothetical protein [Stylosanthes scabra]